MNTWGVLGVVRADKQRCNDAAVARLSSDSELQSEADNEEDDGEYNDKCVEAAFALERAAEGGDGSGEPSECKGGHDGDNRHAANHNHDHQDSPARLYALLASVVPFQRTLFEPLCDIVAEVDQEHDLNQQEHGSANRLAGGGR